MLKLMKMEMYKFKLGGYIKGALIANFVIIGLLTAIGHMSKIETEIPFSSDMAYSLIDTLIRGTFIVFASVLISRIIIEEFRSKSITVLFLYPISRRKLIMAKLAIIMLFTFCSIIASQLIVTIGFSIINSFAPTIPSPFLNVAAITNNAPSIFMNAIAASIMCLIPLYFGMRKYSVSTTILSSLIIVSIVCQYYDETSLNSIIIIPITLVLIGAGIAYFTIKNIGHRDVV